MASCQIYPFVGTNATLFSEELIHYVLNEFGYNVRKPQRKETDESLKNYEMFSFTPEIGKTVCYLSRKHAILVVMTCYKSWKYIKSHRASVTKDLLYNDILIVCRKYCSVNDDLALFLFMAIVAEYARFAIIDNQGDLLQTVYKALSYCMTDVIPEGYVATIGRLKRLASSFDMPEVYINRDDSQVFRYSFCAYHIKTPVIELGTPLSYKSPLGTRYDITKEELEAQCLHRELRRGLAKHQRKDETHCETLKADSSTLVNRQENVASSKNVGSSVSSTQECKPSESNEKNQNMDEENSANNYESSEKTRIIRNDQIQSGKTDVYSTDVSSTDLHCPTKNELDTKDITESLEKINLNDVAN